MEYIAHKDINGRTQTVKEHLENTAKLAAEFSKEFNAEEWGYTCGIAHDIGKYSNEFQKRINGAPINVDHSTAGAKELSKTNGYYLSYCVAGHHSGLPNKGSEYCENDGLQYRLNKDIPNYDAYKDEIALPNKLKKPDLAFTDCYDIQFFIRMLYSCLVDADYLDTETFIKGHKRNLDKYNTIEELFDTLLKIVNKNGWLKNNDKESLNYKRSEILSKCLSKADNDKGMYSLTVPTGGGKTISSLAFGLRHAMRNNIKRIIYIIPYTSIIEQNAKVFSEILGDKNVLENHCNAEYCNYENEISDDKSIKQLATENWDFPIVVTTNVQFFESLYSNRSSKCRKLHNIANSVLIFDEAQMLPNQYLVPCMKAIEELVKNYGCTSLLCTATQPSLQKFLKTYKISEICENYKELYNDFRRCKYKYINDISKADLISGICKEKQVLCIVNTKSMCQNLYDMFDDKDGVYHLSTFMCPKHRRSILEEIRNRLAENKRCILISTSLVEAGVDLDFKTVYRELAGLDSIIQAGGRCNRENRFNADDCYTYVFEFIKDEMKQVQYIKQPVSITKPIINGYNDFSSPDAITNYFDKLHQIKGNNLDLKNIVEICKDGSFQFENVADKFRIIEQNTKTILIIIDQESENIANALKNGVMSRELMRSANQYIVNVFPNVFDYYLNIGALKIIDNEIAILEDKNQYSNQVGLKNNIENGMAIFA